MYPISQHASADRAKPVVNICRWIKARLGDTDAGVREVAAEVLGTLAANYHAVKQNPLPITHMLFKLVLDSLHVKKEQIAAGSAVQRMAPHVEPLSNLLLKQLIKLIQGVIPLLLLSWKTTKPMTLTACKSIHQHDFVYNI